MFTKVDVERISLIFFASRGGQKGAVFYIYCERIAVIAQSENFLPKGVSFYPSISPFIMKGYAGHL